MKNPDNNILTTLRGYFLIAAAEALREEAVQEWPKLGGIAQRWLRS